MSPTDPLHRFLDDVAYIFSALLPGCANDRDYNAAVRRAEDALVAAEAENEVHEATVACGHHQPPSNRWVGYWCSLNRGHEGHHSARADGETLATWADPPMDWRGWAVPAILEVMAEEFPGDWAQRCEEIAPKIADRIACDPQRAIEALTHDTISR